MDPPAARCPSTRWLVRFGYDGGDYSGWARQPGRRTVEGEIRKGLVRCGFTSTTDALRLEVASRTDAGVSARANALAIRASLPGDSLLRMLNGISPDLFFTHATEVPESFPVLRPRYRVYRYYLPRRGRKLTALRLAARAFQGNVDARTFGRGLRGAEPQFRTIETARLLRDRNWIAIEIRAPQFVWGMIRKIVAALDFFESGVLSEGELTEAIRGKRRLALPLAPPHPLVLWEVHYPIAWRFAAVRLTRSQSAFVDRTSRQALVHEKILGELAREFGNR